MTRDAPSIDNVACDDAIGIGSVGEAWPIHHQENSHRRHDPRHAYDDDAGVMALLSHRDT